jgi:hypothetical protein
MPSPAGDWYLALGLYLVLQYLDPVTGQWTFSPTCGWDGGIKHISSDGFSVRIANLTGCIVGAVVTAYGSGYVQASTTITVIGSTATFLPIVGGQLATLSLTVSGAGFGTPPVMFIPAPPPAANNSNGVGGIPASAYAILTSATVSGFSMTNPGAGYPSAPTAVLLPNPTDPNLSTGITNATVTFSLVGSGSLTGALCTNPGAALVNGSLTNVTLAVAGAGTSATVVPQVMQTVISGTVSGTGVGYGTTVPIWTSGGGASLGAITNGPEYLGLAFRPRPANITMNSLTQGGVGTIIDGGLFLTAPTFTPFGGVATTAATLAMIMGGRPDIALIQPAP